MNTQIFKHTVLFCSVFTKKIDKKHKNNNNKNRLPYTNKILAALIFSCLGDALLDHDCFVYGMCAFGVAQFCYICAFGFRPLKLWVGIPLYMTGLASKKITPFNLKQFITILHHMHWIGCCAAAAAADFCFAFFCCFWTLY